MVSRQFQLVAERDRRGQYLADGRLLPLRAAHPRAGPQRRRAHRLLSASLSCRVPRPVHAGPASGDPRVEPRGAADQAPGALSPATRPDCGGRLRHGVHGEEPGAGGVSCLRVWSRATVFVVSRREQLRARVEPGVLADMQRQACCDVACCWYTCWSTCVLRRQALAAPPGDPERIAGDCTWKCRTRARRTRRPHRMFHLAHIYNFTRSHPGDAGGEVRFPVLHTGCRADGAKNLRLLLDCRSETNWQVTPASYSAHAARAERLQPDHVPVCVGATCANAVTHVPRQPLGSHPVAVSPAADSPHLPHGSRRVLAACDDAVHAVPPSCS